ncbi:uncharacterized protein V1516DRAFT_670294 [Lipomyces oligophaga]|uniref:uncharacterized protein n=1 Tax=Lipomyces oligophaga TaxID=45792 RepID=UPI0034CD1879
MLNLCKPEPLFTAPIISTLTSSPFEDWLSDGEQIPVFDIKETKNEYVLEAEIVDPTGFSLSFDFIDSETIMIKGSAKRLEWPESKCLDTMCHRNTFIKIMRFADSIDRYCTRIFTESDFLFIKIPKLSMAIESIQSKL